MKRIIIYTIFIALPILSFGQKIDATTARVIAKKILLVDKKNIEDQVIENTIPVGIENDTLFFIFTYKDEGFAIISADRTAPPVLGHCKKGKYNLEKMPSGLLFLLEKYKYIIYDLRMQKAKPTKKVEKLWTDYLSSSLVSMKSYVVGENLIETKWGQDDGYNLFCPDNRFAGCTAVAMAQILKRWNCQIDPQGSVTYDGIFYMGGSANFDETTYNWKNMDSFSPDSANALLIYHAGVSCRTLYYPNSSSSTPNKARDGFVEHWGISSDADVKWRISHLSNWKDMLKNELDLERPILYSAGAFPNEIFEIPEGHSWVIDGYNSDDNFLCNWGWEGDYDGPFSLGDFNPDGKDPLNQFESAIFNVVPEQPDGVAQPQLEAQVFTYNPNGYTITIPEAFGATSYEWTTSHGTITGTGTSVILETDCSSTVQVRAFNDQCDIYSSYDTELITIEYPPISGSSTVCTSGSTFTLNALPEATIYWTHSTNLTYVSGQGTVSYRVKASRTSGAGWVEAEISTGSCSPIILHKDIWVGKPGVPTTNPSGYPTIDVPLEAYLYIALGNTPGASASMPTTWWSTGSLEVDNATPSGCTFHAYDTGIGNFYVTTQNACGTSAPGGGTVDVYSGGGGELGPVALSIMPNPADDYVNAEIIDDSLEIDNTDLQIKLFNYRSTPVYMGNSHQKSFRINTGQLPRGLYILQVIYNGKKYSKQVLVEH